MQALGLITAAHLVVVVYQPRLVTVLCHVRLPLRVCDCRGDTGPLRRIQVMVETAPDNFWALCLATASQWLWALGLCGNDCVDTWGFSCGDMDPIFGPRSIYFLSEMTETGSSWTVAVTPTWSMFGVVGQHWSWQGGQLSGSTHCTYRVQ